MCFLFAMFFCNMFVWCAYDLLLTIPALATVSLLSSVEAAVKVDARERAKRTMLNRKLVSDMRRSELPPLDVAELLQLTPGRSMTCDHLVTILDIWAFVTIVTSYKSPNFLITEHCCSILHIYVAWYKPMFSRFAQINPHVPYTHSQHYNDSASK